MSIFYLLPPRPLLGRHFADYLRSLLPGLPWEGSTWRDLADVLAVAVARQPNVYIVHREDLPPGEDPSRALVDGFGAEVGDQVIEVRPGARPGELTSRQWRVALGG